MLAADNGADMRLADADDPILAAAGIAAVHCPLLVMEVLDNPVTAHEPAWQGDTGARRPGGHQSFDVAQVATKILQLLLDSPPDHCTTGATLLSMGPEPDSSGKRCKFANKMRKYWFIRQTRTWSWKELWKSDMT